MNSTEFTFATFISGYEINPSAIPVAILDVRGMLKITKNAGNASSNASQSMWRTEPIIRLPTIINDGAVIADTPETALTNGPKNVLVRIEQLL